MPRNQLSGMGEKLHSLVPKAYFGYTQEGLWRYEYDPAKARDLLAAAGYPDGFEVALDTHNSPSYLPDSLPASSPDRAPG